MQLGEDIEKDWGADKGGVDSDAEFMLADFIIHLA